MGIKSLVVGDNYEFELVKISVGFSSFVFKVLQKGVDTGHKITVKLYGGFILPPELDLSIKDRNKLSMVAIKEYKKGYYF